MILEGCEQLPGIREAVLGIADECLVPPFDFRMRQAGDIGKLPGDFGREGKGFDDPLTFHE